MHETRYEERACKSSECTTLPKSPHVHPTLPKSLYAHHPGSPLNPVLLDFYGGFITQAWLIRALAIGDRTHL